MMCENCYEEYGSPAPDAISSAAVQLVSAVYSWSMVGGNLRIVLDDWNIEEENLKFCAGLGLTSDEAACLSALKAMTIGQRAACLSEYEGFARLAVE